MPKISFARLLIVIFWSCFICWLDGAKPANPKLALGSLESGRFLTRQGIQSPDSIYTIRIQDISSEILSISPHGMTSKVKKSEVVRTSPSTHYHTPRHWTSEFVADLAQCGIAAPWTTNTTTTMHRRSTAKPVVCWNSLAWFNIKHNNLQCVWKDPKNQAICLHFSIFSHAFHQWYLFLLYPLVLLLSSICSNSCVPGLQIFSSSAKLLGKIFAQLSSLQKNKRSTDYWPSKTKSETSTVRFGHAWSEALWEKWKPSPSNSPISQEML